MLNAMCAEQGGNSLGRRRPAPGGGDATGNQPWQRLALERQLQAEHQVICHADILALRCVAAMVLQASTWSPQHLGVACIMVQAA